jgi:hypothetical protein
MFPLNNTIDQIMLYMQEKHRLNDEKYLAFFSIQYFGQKVFALLQSSEGRIAINYIHMHPFPLLLAPRYAPGLICFVVRRSLRYLLCKTERSSYIIKICMMIQLFLDLD